MSPWSAGVPESQPDSPGMWRHSRDTRVYLSRGELDKETQSTPQLQKGENLRQHNNQFKTCGIFTCILLMGRSIHLATETVDVPRTVSVDIRD